MRDKISPTCRGRHPELRPPRRDPLSREGEDRTIRYAGPSHGRIIAPSGRSRSAEEAQHGRYPA
jgi:hypothetical protein